MLVTPNQRKRKFAFKLPPAPLAALAILLVAMAVRAPRQWLAQAQPAAAPVTQPVAAGAADTEGSVDDAKKDEKSYWEMFTSGGTVMWILAGASVLAVAIIFERCYSLRKSQVIPASFIPGLKDVMRDLRDPAQRTAGLEYCRDNDSPIARMVTAFIKRLPRGFEAAEKALEDAGGNEALKLRANMRFFYSIGSVATLLGLIGTIAGMIKAFMVTAHAGNADNKVELLSTGIYQAMVCTFGGLAVAILVTIFYYYFVGRIERLIGQINDELNRFSEEFGLNAASGEELSTTGTLMRNPVPGSAVAPLIPVGTAYHHPAVT